MAAARRHTLAAARRATLAAARRVGLIAAWGAAGLTALSVDGGSQARGRASRAVLRLGLGAGRRDRDLGPRASLSPNPGAPTLEIKPVPITKSQSATRIAAGARLLTPRAAT